jgi:Right handed beta helix region
MNIASVLVLLVVIFLSASTDAATWYVKTPPAGSDSNSCTAAQSPASPKASISAALGCIGTATGAGAGHTVEVDDGVYVESLDNNVPGGTSWAAPFTLKTRNRRMVTIRPASGAQFVINFARASNKYIEVNGFILDGANVSFDNVKCHFGTGTGEATFVRLQDNEIENAYNQGVLIVRTCTGAEVIGNTVHDNSRIGNDFTHGIYYSASNGIIADNEVYNEAGWGIHVYDSGGNPTNILIQNNRVYNNARVGARGLGIQAAGENLRVYQNIIYGNNGGIAVQYGACRGTQVYNNTVYNNNRNAASTHWGVLVAANCRAIQVRNDILFDNNSGAIVDLSGGVNTIDHNCTTDPLFVNAAAADFRLCTAAGQPSVNCTGRSGAIDAGIAVGLPYNGPAPDCGALETG